ncbi:MULTISPECIES: peroxiredoxin [Odoribacteraceae]|jgi:peroxiredoxin (alkyl hydroperoxide reductase subunit C)|uniref:peroxiredoxin n=3 Tax=Culturomica TaxID=1926651 RepID=UPI00033E90D8|nr:MULTISPECIES: peroxiredoxin [Odoribacteraceae]RHV95607.1 peroxiredoxin [Odoribacter sp. OF09-27XD]CCZ06210.1 putative uncharacterized protein [Odoribacter sp. CAG:788]HBO27099.1 peroxiredoxin [Culturomica sp.]
MNTMENDITAIPRIGDDAPAFKAITTEGEINFPDDFQGRWIILFSHPADFTPVCTTEFITFGNMTAEFEKMNCQLVGLSIDGVSSHIAWLRTIEEKINYKGMKNVKIHFPVIDDVGMKIAKTYGMLHPGESNTKAVRAVFFIDPEGIIRTILYYPMALGRNFDEMKRILIGLQTIDRFKVALPADWKPGDDVITTSPGTMEKAEQRANEEEAGMKCYDWFLCTKPLPLEKIEKNIRR